MAYTHVFSGRGAFIHIGVFIGTMMAANVFMVIIPNQRKITDALLRGEKPDPALGATGKQRSLHNTYLTLPVLVMMVSNHFAMLTDHPYAWLLAGLIVIAGVALRHFLVRHEVGDPLSKIAWTLPVIAVALGIAYAMTWVGPINHDWLNLLLRWGHMIAGIAWIGTSFYFVALDFSLRKGGALPAGVAGEAWEVHGGGFYNVQKYLSAPASLPKDLIWFKWEAYLTWVSGFLLMILLYYVGATTYLIDPSVMDLTQWQAIGISIASLAAGWLIYDVLCRSPLGRHTAVLALLLFALIMAAAYFFTHVFSGRGALIHVGAFIGTIMAANVFMIIIPNQRRIVASLLKGEAPDTRYGIIGKQRSLHNTYLTLPVLADDGEQPLPDDHRPSIKLDSCWPYRHRRGAAAALPGADRGWRRPDAHCLDCSTHRSCAGRRALHHRTSPCQHLSGRGCGCRGSVHRANALQLVPCGQADGQDGEGAAQRRKAGDAGGPAALCHANPETGGGEQGHAARQQDRHAG